MAQKREIEEAEFQVPENRPLCKPPIPTPHPDLDDDDDDEQKKPNASRFTNISDPKLSGSANLGSSSVNMSPDRSDAIHPSPTEEKAKEDMMKRREVNRCSGCRRKVGLMGFRCRCGDLFCSEHRYSDRHDCSFDYKAAGREAIARENPVVRPAKILKV